MTPRNFKSTVYLWLVLGHIFIFLLGSDDLEGCKCLSGFIICDTHPLSNFISWKLKVNPFNKAFSTMLKRGVSFKEDVPLKNILAFVLCRLEMKLGSIATVISP